MIVETTNTLVAAAASLFSVTFSPEVRTAYVSRGKVIDDRPIQVNSLRADMKLGAEAQFGRIGAWHWGYNALTPRVNCAEDQFAAEFDWGAYYHYDLELADGWSLGNEIMPDWIIMPSADPVFEWRVSQSLKNPYVVPFWLMRRDQPSSRNCYFNVGLMKPISFRTASADWLKPLVITPMAMVEFGNSSLMTARYGRQESGGAVPTGLQAIDFELRADYAVTENFGVYVSILQFDLLNPKARRQSHKPNCRDITVFAVGVKLSF